MTEKQIEIVVAAIRQLKKCHGPPDNLDDLYTDEIHREADEILCKVLLAFHLKAIVEAWKKIKKW